MNTDRIVRVLVQLAKMARPQSEWSMVLQADYESAMADLKYPMVEVKPEPPAALLADDAALWKPDVVIYHGGCDDGFGAAWVVHDALSEFKDIEFYYGAHDRKIDFDAMKDKNVLFVDFSKKNNELLELYDVGKPKSIVIIDHHKTAEAELKEWSVGPVGKTAREDTGKLLAEHGACTGRRIVAFFDMEHSGAAMTFHYFHGTEGMLPPLLKHIEARDLWKFQPNTKEVSAALRTYAHDFDVWDELQGKVNELIEQGKHILRGHQKIVASICDEAHTFQLHVNGLKKNQDAVFRIPAVNAPYHFASDCAHELLKRNPDAPFVGAWFIKADGRRQWSLRSENAREDVSEIAKCFGGGGHRNAAGFTE